jgi:hypothetical protein
LSQPRATLFVFTFFASLLLLTSSGRLASTDAGAELQASTLMVTTGALTSSVRPSLNPDSWQQGVGGRFHEPHDIGPVLLLAPAAWIGHVLSSRSARDDFDSPPVAARVVASLTTGVIAAAGCCGLFLAFALDYDTRSAFLLTLLLPLTTMFWPFSRTAWDVVDASAAICAFVYTVRRATRPEANAADLMFVAAAVVVASAIRYSLLPFLLLAMGAMIVSEARLRRVGMLAPAAAVVILGLLPSLLYNHARLGSWFVPANASPAILATTHFLAGNMVHDAWSLVASPNRGLLVFAPLVVLTAGLPSIWKRLSVPQQRTIAITGVAAISYLLFIAKLRNWAGGFGWGPRYALAILPIVMYAACTVFEIAWRRHRTSLIAFVAAAFVWQLPAVLTNWSNAIVTHPRGLDKDALLPYQHIAAWHDFVRSLTGHTVAVTPLLAADPGRLPGARFPDIWLARLAERSAAGAAAAAVIGLALIAGVVWSLSELLRAHNERAQRA